MSVNTSLSGLSQTAASNGPDGTVDPPSTIDDAQRYLGSFIATLRDGKGFTGAVTLASASTTDIGAQNAFGVEISGTTTITSFGTAYNGPRFLRFTGALTLTHNATTLNLPGAANITTVAGDAAIAMPNQAANGWNVVSYSPPPGVVTLTGNQTIAGIKTFSSTPVIPFAAGTPLKVLGTAIATLDNSTGTYATVTSLAITPASSSNKILVCMTGQLTSDTLAAANVAAQWQLLRGVTQIASGSTFADTSAGGVGTSGSMACSLLDAPATASSVTYFLQIRTTNSSSFSRARNSSITLTEVQG